MLINLSKLLVLVAGLPTMAIEFRPERWNWSTVALPTPFDVRKSQSQNLDDPSSSFWSTSFVSASNGHQYMVTSHVIPNMGNSTMYRAAILDITNPNFDQFERLVDRVSVQSFTGVFNATFDDYGFGSTHAQDGFSQLRTWSKVSGVEFDMTFNMSSPVIFNGGLGTFLAGNETVYEWSMPAGETSGWIELNGTKAIIDPQRSLTWYDRQWGGGPPHWTWFELHLDTREFAGVVPMSVWYWDTEDAGNHAIATVRDAEGIQRVVPVTSLQSSNRTFTSEASGAVYPLDWELHLADGTVLSISSIKEDQELHAEDGSYPTYEGYINVTGTYQGLVEVQGYGLVELVPPGILGH